MIVCYFLFLKFFVIFFVSLSAADELSEAVYVFFCFGERGKIKRQITLERAETKRKKTLVLQATNILYNGTQRPSLGHLMTVQPTKQSVSQSVSDTSKTNHYAYNASIMNEIDN